MGFCCDLHSSAQGPWVFVVVVVGFMQAGFVYSTKTCLAQLQCAVSARFLILFPGLVPGIPQFCQEGRSRAHSPESVGPTSEGSSNWPPNLHVRLRLIWGWGKITDAVFQHRCWNKAWLRGKLVYVRFVAANHKIRTSGSPQGSVILNFARI